MLEQALTRGSEFVVRKICGLDTSHLNRLRDFISTHPGSTPYHSLDFARVIDSHFKYSNDALVLFDDRGDISGYLPQWSANGLLESVPWRDRGGPIVRSADAIEFLVQACREIVEEKRLKGCVWKDFVCSSMNQTQYYLRTIVRLEAISAAGYWEGLDGKERRTVRKAEKEKLEVSIEEMPPPRRISTFYRLFFENRHRLGVPVYNEELFHSYFRYLPAEQRKFCSVEKDGEMLCGLILLESLTGGIDAYSASSAAALKWRANDVLIFHVLQHCLRRELRWFDFGADSPSQLSLLNFKEKWLGKNKTFGETSAVTDSSFGNFRYRDLNAFPFSLARPLIRLLPESIYSPASRRLIYN